MDADIKFPLTLENGSTTFLKECLGRFGSMNKNDYEVALFHLLLENDCCDMSDFAISKLLRIPESKVKRLRYESSLVYPVEEHVLKAQFVKILQDAQFRKGSYCVRFSIGNKLLRSYLSDLLEHGGRFIDSSFNSNIVSIDVIDFIWLLARMKEDNDSGRKKIDAILKNAKRTANESAGEKFPAEFREKVLQVLPSLLDDLSIPGKKTVSFLIDEITAMLSSPKENKAF